MLLENTLVNTVMVCPVHYSVNGRQLSEARCFRVLPHVRRHEQGRLPDCCNSLKLAAALRVCKRLWDPLPLSRDKILKFIVNVLALRVFPCFGHSFSVFSVWETIPQGFCDEKSTRSSRAASLVTRGCVSSGVSAIYPLGSLREKYMPFI